MKIIIIIALLLLQYSCSTNKSQPLVGHWIEIMPANPQIIQGVTLNTDGTATSIGMATLQYEKWKSEENKTIIPYGKSIGNGQTIDFSDTLNIIKVTPDTLVLGKYGMYQVAYTKVIHPDSIPPFNIVDSLAVSPDLGEVMERKYQGILPATSSPGIEYTLLLYNQRHSGDGVYKLTQRYIEAENGKDVIIITYGRQYTLRGDAVNPDAVVYQLIPFASAKPINLLFQDNKLEFLNKDFQRADSKLNNTLTLVP